MSNNLIYGIRAIVILPIESNFRIKNFQRYRMMMEAAESISLNSNYFVVTSNEYEIKGTCSHKEMFICSNLKDILTEINIEPSQTLFIEFTVVEETETVMSELSGRISSYSEKSADSGISYKIIIRGYHYREDEPAFEERYIFKPDINSLDVLEPAYKYQRGFLKNMVDSLSGFTNQWSSEADILYYINYFQAVFPHKNNTELCYIERGDIHKEIEAEMLFELYYKNINSGYLKRMKNYYCGILIEKTDKSFDKNNQLNKGDLLISYCKKVVYGYYSIKNSLISKGCSKYNIATVIRGSDKIEINL